MRLKNRVFFYELTGIVLIFLAALPRRLIFPLNGLFAFNYDQGRDFLAVSKIIWEKDFVLIGQTTGLPGIFYGPWWYYFLASIVFISGGDPQKVAIYFAILAILSIVGLYLLLRTITKNTVLSLFLSTVAAISNLWMFGSSNIWNPGLTPVFFMISIYSLYRISKRAEPLCFFIYGVSLFLAMDTTASFGALLFIFFIAAPFIFKKVLFKKQYIFAILGAFIVLLPRILFELRNNFLMTRSLIDYLTNPKIYGGKSSIFERFLSRLDQMFRIFSEAFTDENKILAILVIVSILSVPLIILKKNKRLFTTIRGDFILIYLSLLLISTIVFFTVFPDTVWDYYLVALPTIIILIVAQVLSYGYRIKILKLPIILTLLVLIFLNFRTDLLPPYRVDWQGDGATYINEKRVMDFIASQNPTNYSFFAYSPAIFDYPFDYLIWWYSKKGLIEQPKENQQIMYLIIRETPTKRYLDSGWDGDKTKDKTQVLEQKYFTGDLLVEKHLIKN